VLCKGALLGDASGYGVRRVLRSESPEEDFSISGSKHVGAILSVLM